MTRDQEPRAPSHRTCVIRYADRILEIPLGRRLLDVILDNDIDHRHICGGNGFCTSCRVEVLQGQEHLSPVSELERERLGRNAGWLRLACQTRVHGPAHVRVPRPTSGGFSPDADGID